MEIIGPFILSLFSGFSTMLGIIPIYFKIKKIENVIVFTLSFSIGIMICISIFDLLPSSIIDLINSYTFLYGIIMSFLMFLLGYLTIYLINIPNNNSSLYRIGWLSTIALMVHNFPEGIVVFLSGQKNIRFGLKMASVIMMHNIPEGMIISLPLFYSGQSRVSVIKMLILCSISEPIGALLSYLFLSRVVTNNMISFILIFVSGLMISLSINEILYELIKYKNKLYMVLGFIFSLILSLFLFL